MSVCERPVVVLRAATSRPAAPPVTDPPSVARPHRREEVQMENPRPEKVAVVDEIKARFEEADAVLLTEYRGLNVSQISELRRALRAAGGEYKVYKNTLVGFAAEAIGLELGDLLTGPTALAFVTSGGDTKGDPVTVA